MTLRQTASLAAVLLLCACYDVPVHDENTLDTHVVRVEDAVATTTPTPSSRAEPAGKGSIDPGSRWQVPVTTMAGEVIDAVCVIDNDYRSRSMLISLVYYGVEGLATAAAPRVVELLPGAATACVEFSEHHVVVPGSYYIRLAREDGYPHDGSLVSVAIVSRDRGTLFTPPSLGSTYVAGVGVVTPPLN